MKKIQKNYLKLQILLLVVFIPFFSHAQTLKNVEILLECVEYLGNDSFIANFGYYNPNYTTVTVDEKASQIIYNGGGKKSYVLNTFEPGRHAFAVSKAFEADDALRWQVKFPNGNVVEVHADSSSLKCTGSTGYVEPYYATPEGGKLVSLIGTELTALYEKFVALGSVSSDDIFQISDDGQKVLVEVIPVEGKFENLLTLLRSSTFGLTDEIESEDDNLVITGMFPISKLNLLNDQELLVAYMRPAFPAISNKGITTTQGDIALRTDFVRGAYNVKGEGVKVGVISNSYNTKGNASIDIANGDLPENVTVLKEYTRPGSDEGRAMMQIIHDIAPNAALYFRTGAISEMDFATGITELQQAGCTIIVDDISYLTEPFFYDGMVAQTIDSVANLGVSYFSAAGNFGDKAYTGTFTAVPAPDGFEGTAHNFSNGDVFQNITLEEGFYTTHTHQNRVF